MRPFSKVPSLVLLILCFCCPIERKKKGKEGNKNLKKK